MSRIIRRGEKGEEKKIGRREAKRRGGSREKKKREIVKRRLKNVKGKERKTRKIEKGRYEGMLKGRGCI